MPHTPKRPCRFPGCPNYCDEGVYCKLHRQYSTDGVRGGGAARGYDSKWRAARKLYLRKNPLCVKCRANGRLEPATVIDHIVPHRGDPKLFWDQNNWQPLCKACHDKKTGSGL